MNSSPLPKLIGSADVCRTFGISRRTLDNWIAFRTIPIGFMIGGKRYWREADIHDFVEQLARKARND